MKVTVVGAGNVGATCAQIVAEKNIVKEVVLVDIKEGISEGKALDLWQTAPVNYYDTRLVGSTNDYSKTANSEVEMFAVLWEFCKNESNLDKSDRLFFNPVHRHERTVP